MVRMVSTMHASRLSEPDPLNLHLQPSIISFLLAFMSPCSRCNAASYAAAWEKHQSRWAHAKSLCMLKGCMPLSRQQPSYAAA